MRTFESKHNWIDLSFIESREYKKDVSPVRCSKAIVNFHIIYNDCFLEVNGEINFWMEVDLGKEMIEESVEA